MLPMLIYKKRIAQADLKELQSELEDGVVYAKKDGIVTTVCDPANPPKDGTPFLQLSGASGTVYQRNNR